MTTTARHLELWRLSRVGPLEVKTSGVPRPVREIVAQEAVAHGVTPGEIYSRRVFKSVAAARHAAIWRVANELRPKSKAVYSYPAIGRMFHRDHSSVLNAIKAHQKRMAGGDFTNGRGSV